VKPNGSVYVAVVFAILIGYFGYQWWYNPARAVKRRLGEVAAALSASADDTDMMRIRRLAQLRRYLADDIRVRPGLTAPEITSRDVVLAAIGNWRPPSGGGDIQFADVHIAMESDSAARAYVTVELTVPDGETGRPTIDARDATASLAKRNGEWVITAAESKEIPGATGRPRSP
jgi:hypothetical protein